MDTDRQAKRDKTGDDDDEEMEIDDDEDEPEAIPPPPPYLEQTSSQPQPALPETSEASHEYVIQRGDTLQGIALRFRVDVRCFYSLNIQS